MARTDEVLTKLLENDVVGFVHLSFELLKDECYLWDNKPLDQKVSEVLELIHTEKGSRNVKKTIVNVSGKNLERSPKQHQRRR